LHVRFGQKQTCAAHQPISALPLKADICSALEADIGASSACKLFDNFIGAAEHRGREYETHCFGGPKIDH
jgi:hypothetical protein